MTKDKVFFILYVKECLLFRFIQQNKKKKKKSEMKNTPNRGSAYISLIINILYQETKETP